MFQAVPEPFFQENNLQMSTHMENQSTTCITHLSTYTAENRHTPINIH